MPISLFILVLPVLDDLTHITTIGPSGESIEDVNGKAVSIECFLDFNFGPKTSPAIRCTSFNANLGVYQGELLNKEQYTRAFFESANKDRTYDLQKLRYLWTHLLKNCVA